MVFAFAGDSTITSVFPADFFLFVFSLTAFVLRTDDVVANLSVPFEAPIGVHFIFCNNSLELHLKEEQRNICRYGIGQALQYLVHCQRMIAGEHFINTSFFRSQAVFHRAFGQRDDIHIFEDLMRRFYETRSGADEIVTAAALRRVYAAGNRIYVAPFAERHFRRDEGTAATR